MNRDPMKTVLTRWATATAVLLAMPVTGASMPDAEDALEQELPAAEAILDRCVEAMGGKDALLKFTTRKKFGKLEVDMAGHAFEAKVEENYVAPDKSHILIDGSFFHQVDVCDGKYAWEWRPGHSDGSHEASMDSGVTELLAGSDLKKALAKANFHAAAEWRKVYTKVETLGMADVEGKPAYEVRVSKKDDEPFTHYYDEASGRLVKRVGTTKGHMGEFDMEVLYQNHREFDGVWFATRVHVVLTSPLVGSGSQTWTFSKIVHNEKIPPSLFKMPEGLIEAEEAE
jgi:hypothetical protein